MIEIKITAENAKELTEKLQELAAGLLAELPGETPKEEPKKRTSKKKAEPVETQKTEEPVEEENPKQEEVEVVEETPTVEDLRKVITEFSKADPNFKQKAKDLMTEENYTNLSGIPEDKRAEFMAKLEKLGAK